MLDLIKFKIYTFAFWVLYIPVRVGLRIVYGKKRRDELILQGRFPLHMKLKNIQYSLLWTSAKFGHSGWEPEVSKLLKGINGELFVDIGAGVGYYTLLLANNFNEVLAVEPEPNNASTLRHNTSHLGNVHIVQVAISNENGEATLHINPSNLGGHTITPQDQVSNISTKVKVITLEKLLEGRTASLVKVDTEGAELKILDGAPANKVRAWLIEAHGGETRNRELEAKLIGDGYETIWVTEKHIYAHV